MKSTTGAQGAVTKGRGHPHFSIQRAIGYRELLKPLTELESKLLIERAHR